ncbi:MAG: SsrA-binding protein SmpB [Clostridia bacterium]|nr:SsrA-binding protein SmpB [Clostridia bacterium]
MKTIDNKKAFFDYEIIERFEAGIALEGSEVKSIRAGNASLRDSFCFVEGKELFLKNCRISVYDKSFILQPDPLRSRKLLLHRSEIKRIIGKSKEKGFTIVPLKMYFKGNNVKVEIGLGRGKKAFDKKQTIKDRDTARDMSRQITDHLKEKKGGN